MKRKKKKTIKACLCEPRFWGCFRWHIQNFGIVDIKGAHPVGP